MSYQLKKKIFIKGEIECLTGLRVGGTSSAMSIGGLDNIIIRNPINNEPYIPGSSLKGKMRALIELRDGTLGDKVGKDILHGPSNNVDSLSCKLFGASSNDEKQRPSRIIVRDGYLLNKEMFVNTDVPYAEVKTEVLICRIKATATPRKIERVPAGARFNLDIVINIFSEHDEKEENLLLDTVFNALKLVQDDYLGGYGSRGYGQVKFHIKEIKERSMKYYKGEEDEKTIQYDIPKELQ